MGRSAPTVAYQDPRSWAPIATRTQAAHVLRHMAGIQRTGRTLRLGVRCPCRHLGTWPQAKLAQNVFDVHLDGSFGDEESVRDLSIAATDCQQADYLLLAPSQDG